METLQQIWERLAKEGYETDKGSVHSYIPEYEKLLAPYRETAKNILEIGLFNGHSMRMWEQYFDGSNVYGIDCSETPHDSMADLRPMIAEGTHRIHIFDACNKEEVQERFKWIEFDIIIEDAGHDIKQQVDLYNIWKNYLADGGLYVIEDIQDLNNSNELLNIAKDLTVINLRDEKNRYDDVLVIIRNK